MSESEQVIPNEVEGAVSADEERLEFHFLSIENNYCEDDAPRGEFIEPPEYDLREISNYEAESSQIWNEEICEEESEKREWKGMNFYIGDPDLSNRDLRKAENLFALKEGIKLREAVEMFIEKFGDAKTPLIVGKQCVLPLDLLNKIKQKKKENY